MAKLFKKETRREREREREREIKEPDDNSLY